MIRFIHVNNWQKKLLFGHRCYHCSVWFTNAVFHIKQSNPQFWCRKGWGPIFLYLKANKPTYWIEILKTALCISRFLKSKHMQSTSLKFCLTIFYSFPISWPTVSENYFSRKISKIIKPTGVYGNCALYGLENEDLEFWYLLFDVTYVWNVT